MECLLLPKADTILWPIWLRKGFLAPLISERCVAPSIQNSLYFLPNQFFSTQKTILPCITRYQLDLMISIAGKKPVKPSPHGGHAQVKLVLLAHCVNA
jgi:hypothetical protein